MITTKEKALKALNRTISEASSHTLKSLAQNVHRGVRRMARNAVLSEPRVVGISYIQFRPLEVAYHRPVALAVDGYGNVSIVFRRSTDR